MATSNAIGTGRKLETIATARMPKKLTRTRSACAGKISTTKAPRKAASSISGRATRAMYQKFLKYERNVAIKACSQVSEIGSSIAHSMGRDVSRLRETNGTKTKIRKSTVTSF